MSIFERIKQFFKRIGKKERLLESKKETREEMPGIVSSDKKESKFLEEIKFDPKDLLDPRVCQGDNLVPNILRTLGANENIANNPQAIEEIGLQFRRIVAEQSGLELPGKFDQPTREQIEAIVEALKSSIALSSEAITTHEYSQRLHYGLAINKETGRVDICNFSSDGVEKEQAFTAAAGSKGNIVWTKYSYSSRVTDDHTEMTRYGNTTVLNSDGIAMRSGTTVDKKTDGEFRCVYHSSAIRDDEYPFIVQEEVSVNDLDVSLDPYVGTRYRAIDMKDLSQLGFPEYQRDENGRTTTTPVTFDSREQISEYYQKNKETIDNALMQEPDHGLSTEGLKQSLKAGIRKLAVKAGMLPNEHEHEQETEIAE